ncbi:MAG: T9SS type A sorting domain-containing protein [Bacteroidales bacterium]|nr:T9SS type A sorting domain-containing protein [Bacteroidales bacterium]
MRRFVFLTIVLSGLFFQVVACIRFTPADTIISETWELDTLVNIGGHQVTVLGNPQVVCTDFGRAVSFDGNGDMLLIDANPLGTAKEFTVELIFKPNACFPINTDPRYMHIQDPDDPEAKRVMMEIRVNSRNQWYLDGFMKTDQANLTLIDSNRVHPTGEWMHAAITYKDNVLKTYVNGVQELSGTVAYTSEIVAPSAKTSLGARMNMKNWYNGYMKRFRVTQKALSPQEFMTIQPTAVRENDADAPEISIFPAIADDYVNLDYGDAEKITQISLVNIYGQVVNAGISQLQGNNRVEINTTGLMPGIYFVVIEADNTTTTLRFVVKH